MKIIQPLDVEQEIATLIDGAVDQLTLVSPYFKPWPKLGERIERKLDAKKVLVTIVVRRDNSQAHENGQAYAKRGARVLSVESLHAKIYLSETAVIVTSMNLYGASRDSQEVGVLFEAAKDREQYDQLVTIVRGFVAKSAESRVVDAPRPSNPKPSPSPSRSAHKPTRTQQGTCLRCGCAVALDLDKPLCRDCYQAWAAYENPDYQEQFCHACGAESATSVARPLCRACWRASG